MLQNSAGINSVAGLLWNRKSFDDVPVFHIVWESSFVLSVKFPGKRDSFKAKGGRAVEVTPRLWGAHTTSVVYIHEGHFTMKSLLEVVYNTKRLYSSLDDLPPASFEVYIGHVAPILTNDKAIELILSCTSLPRIFQLP